MELTVEQVSPVVLPLLATAMPRVGTAIVDEGGAAAMLVEPAAPRSRMLPDRSTAPGTIWAIAESVLLGEAPVRPCAVPAGASGAPAVRTAMGLDAPPKHATWSGLSNGLRREYQSWTYPERGCCSRLQAAARSARVQRLPMVPMQQLVDSRQSCCRLKFPA